MPGDADELIEWLAENTNARRDQLRELARIAFMEGSNSGHYDMNPYGYRGEIT